MSTGRQTTEQLLVVNRDLNPLLADLPPQFRRIEPHQVRAVREIMRRFESHRLVFLDAPTGTGKTLIAEVVRRLLRARALYACTTKRLQDQFARDYPYARVVMGRVNYPTQLRKEDWPELSAQDCSRDKGCPWCEDADVCPYVQAKREAAQADVAVLNTAYLLNETRSVRSPFKDRGLVVLDEADELERDVMRHVSVEIGQRRLDQWGWKPPDKVTVVESWRDWLVEHVEKLKQVKARHASLAKDKGWFKEAEHLDRLGARMRGVLAGLDEGIWVYTGRDGRGVSFRPARVDGLCGDLWNVTTGRFLLMSATPISVAERLEACGWQESYGVVQAEHTFPVENRRVRVQLVVGMNAKTKNLAVMASAVEGIVRRHPHKRVLVHTHSYANAESIARTLRENLDARPVVTYQDSHQAEAALAEYLKKDGAVLVAASMGRGVDLPDEACRVQVLTKVPYPYLGDRQVSARLHSRGGQLWYTCEAVRSVVQMCGRGVRHINDHAETYILDKDFERLWTSGRGLWPRWFVDAVVWRPE